MSPDMNGSDRPDKFHGEQLRRLAEFDERLGAGEFELGLELSQLTGEEGLEQQRQAFAFAAWAARVFRDPAEDFDGFVASLWESVQTLYQLGDKVGATDPDRSGVLPESLQFPDDPSVIVWGRG